MKFFLVAIVMVVSLVSGCTSVPMTSKEESDLSKQFDLPSEGKAGLYIYRSGSFGGALKKDIFVNGKCIGETAPNIFFYEEIIGNKEHKISTESEFSANDLFINTESGKNYFIRQYMKIGLFVGGAGVELVNEEKGKKEILQLDMAIKGKCSF